jgi:hypothetical protein
MPRLWTLPTWPFHVTSPFRGIHAAPQRPSCRWTAGRESTNMSGQCGEANLSLLRYHALIPAPTNERQALEREREELPGQIATYQAELDATLRGHTARRERFMWQIRRVHKRMAEIEARLAGG